MATLNRLNRRDFLKALSVTGGASALSACGLDDNVYPTPLEQVLPYVVRPEQVTPGTPTFFATTVGLGLQAWPVLARHREGRVTNVSANAKAPVAPAVPKSAILELQREYSPDRLKAPSEPWDDALRKLATAVREARGAGKKVAWLGPYRSGSIVNLIQQYTANEAVFWEPLGPEAEVRAAELLFSRSELPSYDLSKAHYVLSFGADFLGWWGAATSRSAEYAEARNPNKGHFVARFALVSGQMDQTGANADDWFRAKPGSEALVAAAVAKLVAAKKGYTGPAASLLASADPAAAAAASGLSAEVIESIAAQFAAAPAAVAIPGGTLGASTAAVDLAVATYLLNIVSGNGGVTFGLGNGYQGPIHTYSRLAQLLADMKAGQVDVLLLDDVNPLYSLPAASGVAEALGKVKLIVSLSGHPDESNAAAHLKLAVSGPLEDWGDEEPGMGMSLLRQPAMTALHDTRSLGDILLASGREAGLDLQPVPAAAPVDPAAAPVAQEPFTGTWYKWVKARWKARFASLGTGGEFKPWWQRTLGDGFWHAPSALIPPAVATDTFAWSGAATLAGDGEFFLQPYVHPFRQDGRYANQPWAQEAADPTTGNTWDSWVLVSRGTAKRLGLSTNDLVEIATPNGKIEIGVHVYKDIADDVLGIAFGQGHTAGGSYADGVGRNVVSLLGAVVGPHGTFAWQQSKASLVNKGVKADLANNVGHDDDFKRLIAQTVPAADLAKVGDAPAAHAGELTGVHHLPRDPRLIKANELDFYGLPDHPINRWGLTVDVNACNGCGVCVIACNAENNIPVVGKNRIKQGRSLAWMRINRYVGYEGDDHEKEGLPSETRFMPMMCQQCGHAPCESVCPVLATYHTLDGLNAMIYNRCVGTRYCANACPFKARKFNYHSYIWPEPFNLQLNPDVSTRTMGVMEKCTFCVQRIRDVQSAYRDEGFTKTVPDAALRQLPACAESCPSQALTFGNLNDPESTPSKSRSSGRSYEPLADLNVMSAVNYLAKASFHFTGGHGGGHGEGHGAGHGDAHDNAGHGEETHPPAGSSGGGH